MAKYIHCENCKNRLLANAEKYGEIYEYIKGRALYDMFCDGACYDSFEDGPTRINEGEICYACMLLPDRLHINYEKQKPENWAGEFINII